MTRFKKKLRQIGVSVLLFAATAWGLDASGLLVRGLRPLIENRLQEALGVDVRLGSVDGGLFGSLTLRSLELRSRQGPAWSLQVPRARFTYSWLAWFRHRDPLASLRGIDLDKPVLDMEPAAGTQGSSAHTPLALPALPALGPALSISHGRIKVGPRGSSQDWVRDLGLSARAYNGKLQLSGKALGGPGGELGFSGEADLEGREAAFVLKPRSLPLQAWGAMFGVTGLPQVELSAGELALRRAVPNAGQWVPGWNLDGVLDLSAAQLGEGTLAPRQMRARLRLKDRAAQLERGSFELAGAWEAQGRLGDLRAINLALSISAKNIDLGELARASGAEVVSLTARATLSAELQGAWPEPAWHVSLRSEQAALGSYALGELRGEGSGLGAYGSLSLGAGVQDAERLSLALGRMRSTTGGAWSAKARAKAFPLDSLSWPAALSVSGKGDLDLDLETSGAVPRWRLKAQAPELRVSKLELRSAVIEARLQKGALNLDARGDWRGRKDMHLKAKGVWAKGALSFTQAELGQSRQSWALAKGRWVLGGTDSELDLDLRALPLPWVGELLAQSLSGTVKGSGRWQRKAGVDSVRLNARSTDFHYKDVALPFEVELATQGQRWDLSSLSLRDGELQARAQGEGWAWPLSWTAELDEADLAALAPLLSQSGLEGSASGQVQGRGPLHWSAQLDVEQPRWGALSADSLSAKAQRADGSWRLERLLALQGEQGRLEGEARLQPGQAPSLQLQLKEWTLGKRRWAAQVRTRQDDGLLARWTGGRAAGRIAVEDWSVDGKALPSAEALLRFDGKRLEADELAWGGFRGSARWEQDASEALLEAKADDLAAFSQLLGGPAQGLGQKVAASARWQALGPKGKLHVGMGAVDPQRPLQVSAEINVGLGAAWDLTVTGTASWGAGKAEQRTELQAHASLKGLDQSRLRWAQGPAWVLAERLSLAPADKGNWKLKAHVSAEGLVAVDTFKFGGEGSIDGLGDTRTGALSLDIDRLQANRQVWNKAKLKLSWADGLWRLDERGTQPALRSALKIDKDGWTLKELRVQTGSEAYAELSGHSVGGKIELEGQAIGFPTRTLTRLLDWGNDWTGRVSGNIGIRGSNADLRTTLSLKIEDGSAAGFPFDLATAQVLVQGEQVRLDPLGQPARMSRKGRYQAEVRGQVPLKRPDGTWPPMELKIDFPQADLALLDFMDWVSEASGPLRLKARVTGNPDDPELSASLELDQGTLKSGWMLAPLDKVKARIQIDRNQLVVQALEGWQTDGKGVIVEQADPKRPGMVLENFVPRQFNLRLRAPKAGVQLANSPRLRFTQGIARPDIGVSGDWEEPRLDGTFALEKGAVQWPPVWGRSSAQALTPDAESLPERLRWDLLLKPAPGTQVETDSARVLIDASDKGLRLLGRGAERGLLGRVKVKKGSLQFLTANFLVPSEKDSYIDFQAEAPPYVDIWGQRTLRNAIVSGETTGRDRVVYIHAKGELGRVNIDFSSDDSALNQAQMASLAGLGVDVTGSQAQVGVGSLLGKVTAGLLSKGLRRTGWVDDVGMKLGVVEDALGPTPEPGSNPGSETSTAKQRSLVEVNAGKYVGERWWVGLGGALKEDKTKKGTELNTSVGVEYDLGKQSKLSYESSSNPTGESEQKVLLQKHSSFENYDPKKRRRKYLDSLTPTPAPTPKPTP